MGARFESICRYHQADFSDEKSAFCYPYDTADGTIDEGDLVGPNGETMSQVEYAELYPDSIDIGVPVAMPEGGDHEAA